MGEIFPNWLTKVMLKGARGFNLDAYVMALEGWRRGLTLTWYYDAEEVTDMKIIGFNPLGKSFSLYSKDTEKTHCFYRSRGDKVANEAVDIVQDKHLAKSYFNKVDVPTPNGITFKKSLDDSEILRLIRESNLEYPLVIKPVLGSLGKGVVTNVINDAELFEGLDYIRRSYEYEDLIVEQYVKGKEYRVYVVGDQVVAATEKIPANIIGDGINTIEHLIEMKNETRKDNPYLARKMIKKDESLLKHLKKNNLNLEIVPEQGDQIRLKGQANISAGGDPVDVTDSLNDTIKQIAINAVKAIPGLLHAGVDVISNDDNVVVIEVNATADISMHLFPIEGTPRNVPEHIIDYYFPETKGLALNRTKIYFDYREITEILRNKFAQEITITDAPNGELYKTRYIVLGEVQKVGYRAWIRGQAIKRGIHGYTRNLKNGNVVVVVGSHDKMAVENFEKICKKGPVRAKVTEVKRLEWNSPIRVGFEILKSQ